MRIWCIKIYIVRVVQFKSWIEASVSELHVLEGFQSARDKYFDTLYE
jgi:hypothetical protein